MLRSSDATSCCSCDRSEREQHACPSPPRMQLPSVWNVLCQPAGSCPALAQHQCATGHSSRYAATQVRLAHDSSHADARWTTPSLPREPLGADARTPPDGDIEIANRSMSSSPPDRVWDTYSQSCQFSGLAFARWYSPSTGVKKQRAGNYPALSQRTQLSTPSQSSFGGPSSQ
jgi:hypothetical protein